MRDRSGVAWGWGWSLQEGGCFSNLPGFPAPQKRCHCGRAIIFRTPKAGPGGAISVGHREDLFRAFDRQSGPTKRVSPPPKLHRGSTGLKKKAETHCLTRAGLCLQEDPGCGGSSVLAKRKTSWEMSLARNVKNNLTGTRGYLEKYLGSHAFQNAVRSR